jgi:hypothetical protein
MLRTEADLLRALDEGTYVLPVLYRMAEEAGFADRPGARDVLRDGQERYKHRIRSALQTVKRQGLARRVCDGEPGWLLTGTRATPRRALFVWLPADRCQLELVLGAAAQVLAQADEPMDLIVADPPWALHRGRPDAAYRRVYGRSHDQVLDGYVEVTSDRYGEFTAEWVTAAASALRPGGYLAIITGPQQAARAQVIAEDVAGLTYVNSIAAVRRFGMYTTRRFVHQHHRVTLLTKGPLTSSQRVFHRPAEMPRGRSGEIYAVDVWDDLPEERRRGLLRYDNALPGAMISRIIRATTNENNLVGDPFLGSGTTAIECLKERRRFFGGDLNPNSLRFTMGRILNEVLPTLTTARTTTG